MPHRKTMNVSLTRELEAFVESRVACGRYRSNSEVLRAALRLLEVQERRDTADQLAGKPAAAQRAQRQPPTPPLVHGG
jgi:putative addiction module CopG family antidote